MKNSADLGGCYPTYPSASVDNTLLDMQNSSYPTKPHSIIANYVTLYVPAPPSPSVIKVMLGNPRQSWILDSRPWFMGSGLFISGTWIPDSSSYIPDSKAKNSGFPYKI